MSGRQQRCQESRESTTVSCRLAGKAEEETAVMGRGGHSLGWGQVYGGGKLFGKWGTSSTGAQGLGSVHPELGFAKWVAGWRLRQI